MDVNKVYYII